MKIFFDETQKERGKINTNYSMLRDSLRSEGFEVELYNDFPISEKTLRCNVFVFACPDGSKLGKTEIDALLGFLERGGSLLVIGNAGGDRGLRTNMNEILNPCGIEMLSDQVKDENNNEFNMPTHPVIKDIKSHPTTRGVSEIVIVAGGTVRGSANMKGIAYTSPVAEPPNVPVVVAGEYKSGRIVAVGSYRLFSNYGAGLNLRNNRTFALNIFKWLAHTDTSAESAPSGISSQTSLPPMQKVTAMVPPETRPMQGATSAIPPRPPTTSTSQQPITTTPIASSQPKPVATDNSVLQEIERLRSDISEMREIIARLYSDSLGYLQEMKEEVRSMLDYIRTKEG
ncbi:MAG TPA: DUF4350 domain-containing protein [Candidatus Bathyarchaeia archaeon]|nr:DUF4350 domain-containing protein [Candidatus Bathyarchaeia archaeon]